MAKSVPQEIVALLNPLKVWKVTPRFSEDQLEEINKFFDEKSQPNLIVNEEPFHIITVEDLMEFLGLKKYRFLLSSLYNYFTEEPSRLRRTERSRKMKNLFIMREVEKLKPPIPRLLTREQMIYILDRCVIEPNPKHELKLAFQVFDTEKRDFLEIDLLRDIVTQYGDVFNEEETIELLRDANTRGDGNIVYDEFVESLFSLAPELYEFNKEYLYEDPDEDPSVPPLPPEPEPDPPPPPPPPAPVVQAPPQKPAKGKEKAGKNKNK